MRKIYDLEGLMKKTGATDYFELQKRNYDIIGYLENRQNEILLELAEIKTCLNTLADDEDEDDNEEEEDDDDDDFYLDDDDQGDAAVHRETMCWNFDNPAAPDYLGT